MLIQLSSRKNFSSVYHLMLKNPPLEEEIIYDLRGFNFFEPADIVILTIFIIYFKNTGHTQKYYPPNRPYVFSYLNDIGIFQFINSNFQQPTTIEVINSQSAMPLRRINTSTMNQYIDLAQSYFSNLCPNKDLQFLNITISELINNVHDHSHSNIDAYIFCQYFPKMNKIKLAIGDLGIGIPVSVNNYLVSKNQCQLDDINALKWALKENNSTKSNPRNRGKGLDNLLKFIEHNRSILQIFSNSSLLSSTKDRFYYTDNTIKYFSGTLIQMEIIIDNLPVIDNITEDFWELSQF